MVIYNQLVVGCKISLVGLLQEFLRGNEQGLYLG